MKEFKLFKRFLLTFVVIVLSGPAVVLANAVSSVEEAQAAVSYADLNLESEEDVRVLYERLQYASKEVCSIGTSKGASPVFAQYQTSACYRQTLSNAVENFDNKDLTRIHTG